MHVGLRPQKHHRSKRTTTSIANRERAIVLLDVQPLRQSLVLEFRSEFRKLQKSLHRLRREIDHHETCVRPSFHRWYHGRFSEKVALLDALRGQFEEKRALLLRMRDLYSAGIFSGRGLTRQKAFSQATKDLDAAKRAQQEDTEFDEDSSSEEFEKETPDFSSDENQGRSKRESRSTVFREGSAKANRAKEIKFFYRKIAQVLHPDRNATQNKTLRELWFDTQSAYGEADLERLKLIWTECITEVDPESGEIRMSDLQEAIGKIKKAIVTTQKKKSDLMKLDPTWNFEKKNKEELSKEIIAEFFAAELDLSSSIRSLDREIKVFSGKDRHSGHRRRSSRSCEEVDF